MKVQLLFAFAAGLAVLSSPIYSQSPAKNTPSQDRRIQAATAGEEVGVAGRDGIVASGADVIVTRNGRSETLVRELKLNNGLTVLPDGTLILPDGRTTTLRAEQTLTFEGKLLETPITPTTAPLPVIAEGNTGTQQGASSAQTGAVVPRVTTGGRFADDSNNGAGIGGFYFGGDTGSTSFVTPLNAQTATATTVDAATGQTVFTGTDPRTGRQISTTTDPATGLSVTTTTDSSGNRVSQTQDPRTGLPVTTTTDPRTGRSTSTTIDARTGRTVPAQTQSGVPGARPGGVQPGTSPQGSVQPNTPSGTTQPGAVNNSGTTNQTGTLQNNTNRQRGSQPASGSSGTNRSGGGNSSGAGTSGSGAGSPGTSGGGAGGAGTSGGTSR